MTLILDPSKSFFVINTYYIDHGSRIEITDKTPESQVVETHWKRLTWKEQNKIHSISLCPTMGPNGKVYYELDSIIYREMKMKICLKNWNIKDENDELIPLTDNAIDNLDIEFATALLRQFEEISEPSNDDLEELEKAARRFYEGKKPLIGELPQYIYEHIIAKHYGWTLTEMRSIDYCDFQAHLRLCLVADNKDKEFELQAHGIDTKKKVPSAESIMKKAATSNLKPSE